MNTIRIGIAAAFALALAVGGAHAQGAGSGAGIAGYGGGRLPDGPSIAQVEAAAPQGQGTTYQYRLGSGDHVHITTFGEATLTGDFVVSGAGTVAMPLVGDIRAQGLTAIELQHAVETALRNGYLREPRVSVEVSNFRPFYILGEVTKPGEYPFNNGLTVLNAVATANGFTYRADTRHVFIRHANETGEHEMSLTTTTEVQPGDTIRIKERYF